MKKYYYEFNGELQEVELKPHKVAEFIASNPEIILKELNEIQASELSEFERKKANAEARENRRAEYPDVGDQLDAIMKWAFTETEIGLPAELKSLAAKCMAVKSKYPIEGE